MKKLILFIFISVAFLSNSSFAQYPTIKWWYDTHDASFGQTASGDIDHDGIPELVFGCYRNDSSVHALNAEDGTLLWKYNTHPAGFEGCNDVAPVIYDVDGDDSLEVIVPSSCNPKTFCFNGRTGAVKWITNTRGSDSPPTIADIDNDGKPEILHGEFGGYVICINGEDGSVAWEIAVDLNSWIQTAPTLVDLDSDGQLDFVVATWNFNDSNKVYAYNGANHSLMWTFPVEDYVYHGTAVADLDNDSKPELVIGDYNGKLYCLNGEDGSLAWSYDFGTYFYVGAPASIADLNGDGLCEVVATGWYKMTAFTNTGSVLWNYNIPGYASAFRGAALADINGDDKPDVTFGTGDGLLVSLNGLTGSPIWTLDLAAQYGDTLEIDHAPVIADFDGDGIIEVFIVGGFTKYPDFENNYGRAYMIEAGTGKGPDWPMFQRNILRNSSSCGNIAGIEENENIKENIEFTLIPNPSSGEVAININLAENSDIEIRIYDELGREIKLVTKEKAQAGQHKYYCNDRNNAGSIMKPGIYCCSILVNEIRITKKLILMK